MVEKRGGGKRKGGEAPRGSPGKRVEKVGGEEKCGEDERRKLRGE